MAATITCYGGINEIGGSKILVQDGDVRVLLDFGKSFGRYSNYFDGVFVRERTTKSGLRRKPCAPTARCIASSASGGRCWRPCPHKTGIIHRTPLRPPTGFVNAAERACTTSDGY